MGTAINVFAETKYMYAVPCRTTPVDWANMYMQHIVQHKGLSPVIMVDRRSSDEHLTKQVLWLHSWACSGAHVRQESLKLMARLKAVWSLRMCVIMFLLT